MKDFGFFLEDFSKIIFLLGEIFEFEPVFDYVFALVKYLSLNLCLIIFLLGEIFEFEPCV